MKSINRRSALKAGAALAGCGAFSGLGRAAEPFNFALAVEAAGSAAVQGGTTAGLAIAVVRKGQTVASQGFGLANLETRTPATADSIFRIASVTKTFTSAAIMQLVEQGRLGLEHTLDKFYPDIPNAASVTIQQLLSHTSGIHDFVNGGLPADALAWKTPDEIAGGVARMQPLFDFDAGTHFSYSNSGYILLGGILEKVSGKSYDDYLADGIFKPLGMDRTAVDHLEDVVVGRADGYAKNGSGFRHADHSGLPHAAGAIRSTASDLALWCTAFFDGKVVTFKSVQLMTKPARTRSGAKVGEAHWWPQGFHPRNPPPFVQNSNYGLGWELTTFYGRPAAGHSGGIAGFNSMILRYLDEDLALILLANTENGIIAPWEKLIEAAGASKNQDA